MVTTKEFLALNAGQAQANLNKASVPELVEFLTLLLDGETPETDLSRLPRHSLVKRIWAIYKEESPKATASRIADKQSVKPNVDPSPNGKVHKGIELVPSETDKLFLRAIVEGLADNDEGGAFSWYTKVHSSLDTQYADQDIDTQLDSLASRGIIVIENSRITITERGAELIKSHGILENPPKKTSSGKAPATKPAATPKPKAALKPAHSGNAGIVRLRTKVNPKKAGTAAFNRFELYEDGLTVAQTLAKGVTKEDIRWDSSRGYIEVVTDGDSTPIEVASGEAASTEAQ